LKNTSKNIYRGIGLAVLATIIWSGNFVVARGVIKEIPPVALAFFRWSTGTIILTPFAIGHLRKDWALIRPRWKYFFWLALLGVTLYNTLIYFAGHYLPAVNLALIGTTSSPLMSIALAAIFLKEALSPLRLFGIFVCLAGILLLLSDGSWAKLAGFHFTRGDVWILLAALTFAIYNILVRKKPTGISPLGFLLATFWFGTIMLFPMYLAESANSPAIQWNSSLIMVILYLGIGNSVLSFLFWNASIAELGAGRTALFGNLIPIFSTFEAVVFLHEEVSPIHFISGILVIGGLIIANLRIRKAIKS